MPLPDPTFAWQEAIVSFTIIAFVAFLVTWVVTDLGHVSRTPYVAVLTATTLALSADYMASSGTSVADLVTAGWVWGILGGLVAAGVVTPLVRRLPSGPRPEGRQLAGRLLWEGVVYGFAEAVLLATLPVLTIWQATDALGWTDTAWAKIGSGALALLGALFVILVHHLGYGEFRERIARKKLRGALMACGIQALAFVLTGNVLAPMIAHIVLHGELTLHGIEMPPTSRPEPASTGAGQASVTWSHPAGEGAGVGGCRQGKRVRRSS